MKNMFDPFSIFLLCLMDPVKHCDHLDRRNVLFCFSLVCGLCIVCVGPFSLPVGAIGRL